MLLSLLCFAYAIPYFKKITWKIMFSCVDTIFKIHLFYFVKDNYFLFAPTVGWQHCKFFNRNKL